MEGRREGISGAAVRREPASCRGIVCKGGTGKRGTDKKDKDCTGKDKTEAYDRA